MSYPQKLAAVVLFACLLCWQTATTQVKSGDIVMHLEIGTLSEIVLPEPYTTVQIPVQIVEMRDVPGRNKRVITLHPVIQQSARTNIRIYTQNYDFNIKLLLNTRGAAATESLDLHRYVATRPGKNGAAGNGGTSNGHANGAGSTNTAESGDIDGRRPATIQDFSFRNLLKVKPDLLKSKEQAPAIVKNRVVFAIDHIFHHKDKIVFKATLWNKSSVPYHILHLAITYKEKTGIPLLNERQTKSLSLAPFYERYSRKIVPPGKKSHILYVTSRLSPQDTGFFNCVLVEKYGARNFDFNIPSYIK